MQSQNPMIADFVKLMNGAAGTFAGMTREARDSARERVKEAMGGMDFVSREEFDAVKAMAAKAREENEKLAERIAALEAKHTSPSPVAPAQGRREVVDMNLRAPAIVVAARPHGETAVIARLLTEEHGLLAGYVAGGRGRQLRPVVIPGNLVEVELRAKSESQLPFARLELVASRGPYLTEPLPAAAIGWATALTASALPERNPYPGLYTALAGLLDAICHAGSARDWVRALVGYEALLLRELGYGGAAPPAEAELEALLEMLARQGPLLERYLLADRRGDVMAARERLRERLGRMVR